MTVPNSTNEDLAIKDEAVRYIWAGWFIFVLGSSLVGDTIILIASIKYEAIALPEVMVAFIQHIAVSDLVICISYIFPLAVSLVANKWTFGPLLCHVRPYFSYMGYLAGSFLVGGMVTSKLLILKYPLRSRTWTAGSAHRICLLIWLLALFWPISFNLVDANDVSFDYGSYTCIYEFSSGVWRFLLPVGIVIFNMVPTIFIVVTSVMILTLARRISRESRQGMRWQGVMTVALTGVAYCVSFLPISVYHIARVVTKAESSKPDPSMITFDRIASSFLDINVITNFYIYCLTISSFRHFLRTRTKRLTSCLLTTFASQGNREEHRRLIDAA